MLTVDEQATVDRFGYRGLMITSYNQEGYLSNWHRVTDTLENIEPATLSRAARFAWALLGEIDQSPAPARVTVSGQVAATA